MPPPIIVIPDPGSQGLVTFDALVSLPMPDLTTNPSVQLSLKFDRVEDIFSNGGKISIAQVFADGSDTVDLFGIEISNDVTQNTVDGTFSFEATVALDLSRASQIQISRSAYAADPDDPSVSLTPIFFPLSAI